MRALWTELGVSSVLVIGGAGDYLDVADTVVTCLVMEEILAKAMARGGELPNLPRVKDQLTIDVWNNDFEPALQS